MSKCYLFAKSHFGFGKYFLNAVETQPALSNHRSQDGVDFWSKMGHTVACIRLVANLAAWDPNLGISARVDSRSVRGLVDMRIAVGLVALVTFEAAIPIQ